MTLRLADARPRPQGPSAGGSALAVQAHPPPAPTSPVQLVRGSAENALSLSSYM